MQLVSILSVAVAALARGVLCAPFEAPQSTSLNETTNDDAPQLFQMEKRQGGYYWSMWTEGGGQFNCQNRGSSYTASWNGGGGLCGLGWQNGGSRTVKYSGTYEPKGPGYLSVYGWTRGPLIEYYIVDSHGDLTPGEPWTKKGNFTFEEGSYDIYTSMRVNKPSIDGTSTFQQFWSVRTEPRVGGTITTGKHFAEWSKLGMRLGGHQYMILATEGYNHGSVKCSGNAKIALG